VRTYLVDTHVWLWLRTTPERLDPRALDLVEDGRTVMLFSAASAWEIAIKYHLGKLTLPEPPARYVPTVVRDTRAEPVAVEHVHALGVADLPDHHRDPFDRLLISQALTLRVPILTSDPAFDAYDVDVVDA
jgi:PIN domain nuclease of toxin-antitoxin system